MSGKLSTVVAIIDAVFGGLALFAGIAMAFFVTAPMHGVFAAVMLIGAVIAITTSYDIIRTIVELGKYYEDNVKGL